LAFVTIRSFIWVDKVIISPAISFLADIMASPISASLKGVKLIVTADEKLPGPKVSTALTL